MAKMGPSDIGPKSSTKGNETFDHKLCVIHIRLMLIHDEHLRCLKCSIMTPEVIGSNHSRGETLGP